jgi:hypothetical protein
MSQELRPLLSDGKKVGLFFIRPDGMDVIRFHHQHFPQSRLGSASQISYNTALGVMMAAFIIKVLST